MLIDRFIKLMAEVVPERVIAAQCADAMNIVVDGLCGRDGDRWVSAEATGIGWGEQDLLDGCVSEAAAREVYGYAPADGR